MQGESRERCGFAVLTLLYQQPDWILRRTEQLTFDDALTLRRRTSLDITLDRFPKLDEDVVPVWGDRALLPIMLIGRDVHHDIKVETAAGEPLPFLPRSDERDFLAAGLAELSVRFDEVPDGEVDAERDTRRELVRTIIDGPPNKPIGEVDGRLGSIRASLDDFVRNHVVIATPPVDDLVQQQGAAQSARSRGLIRLTETHAESYPALRRKEFGVDKLRAALRSSPRLVQGYAGHRSEAQPESHLWDRSFRLDDVAITVPTSQIDGAESFHVELVCPPGVYMEDAALVSTVETGGDGGEPRSVEIAEILEDDRHWDAAHVHYSARIHQDKELVRVDSVFLVVLRPMYHGLMHAGQNLSALSAALLWILTFTIGWRAAGWDAVVRVPFRADDTTDAVVAMLLLAPTAALGLLIRQEEHLLTKHVAAGYRRRLGALAGITFAAATVFATGLGGWQLFVILLMASIAGTVVAGITVVGARYSETRLKRPPAPPPWATPT